jgi:hypothetical protein
MICAIIPFHYNKNRKYLGKTNNFLNYELCLKSLYSKKSIKKIIIIDSSSESNPGSDFLRSFYNEKIKYIKVENQKTLNISKLLNIGLNECNEKYFMRHDLDSIIHENFDFFIYKYRNFLNKNYVLHQNLIGHQKFATDYYSEKYYCYKGFIPICQKKYEEWNKFSENLDWNKFEFSKFLDLFLENHPFIEMSMLSSHIICKKKYLKKTNWVT